jgi:zinc transporter ZupT
MAGCYSMQPETIYAEDISKQDDYEILSLVLKDSSKTEKVEPSHINFIMGVTDSVSTFVYSLHSNISKNGVTSDTGDMILQTAIIASMVVLVVMFVLSVPEF